MEQSELTRRLATLAASKKTLEVLREILDLADALADQAAAAGSPRMMAHAIRGLLEVSSKMEDATRETQTELPARFRELSRQLLAVAADDPAVVEELRPLLLGTA